MSVPFFFGGAAADGAAGLLSSSSEDSSQSLYCTKGGPLRPQARHSYNSVIDRTTGPDSSSSSPLNLLLFTGKGFFTTGAGFLDSSSDDASVLLAPLSTAVRSRRRDRSAGYYPSQTSLARDGLLRLWEEDKICARQSPTDFAFHHGRQVRRLSLTLSRGLMRSHTEPSC